MTQEDVAKKIGISLSRFNAKLNETGGAEFSLGEVISLVKLFNLSSKQRDQIFLE
nr:MAG TPA: LAMBDA REPRESSOR (TRIPLE MUTANT)/DNA COMPLEX-DNA COMPLEX, DOUBLE HELIX, TRANSCRIPTION-DNA.1A [Caudoviricetes sp.]